MSYYAEPDSPIKDKVKAVLDLTNDAILKNERATGADRSEWAAKNDFVSLKVEVDKLDINKLGNIQTSLSILKIKVDDLDFCILMMSVDLKKN